ncbi:MAG: hypothetical protein Q8N35_03240 [Methylococcaceae bacterium]|nr:hypothetical protein [Methylococcaceae bacterium]MDP2392717.1 hypothetical protein [Methylococcaceae bacterium]MDP3018582.1 hypothetical protein [Methylococcaceae bacterium]MDP3391337.1 hypothetical protein [Methylococcaceae bacterium]MDP3933463.1 hypothetical protein [Methylococcaceae bacterium]
MAATASARANISVKPVDELSSTLGDMTLKPATTNALRAPNALRKHKYSSQGSRIADQWLISIATSFASMPVVDIAAIAIAKPIGNSPVSTWSVSLGDSP